jgi:hypothetical protein
MPQVNIPESLFREVEKVLPKTVSASEYVVTAVREKLDLEGRKREFFRLSDRVRAAMTEQGLTESDILREFEATRQV